MLSKSKINPILLILGLLAIGVISYKAWLSFNIFVYGDWWFAFKEKFLSDGIPSVIGPWGGPWLWRYPFLFIEFIFGLLGLGSSVSDKFLVFWPIVFLAPLVGFLLVRKITNSNLSGFVGSLIFSYNTYFLSIDTQGHELLPLAFIWGTFGFISFIYLLENKKKIFISLTTLLLFIAGFVDPRSLYIVSSLIFLYFFYNQFFLGKSWKINFKQNGIAFTSIFFILFLLNLYWLIPSIATSSLTNNEFLARTLFGSQFYNLQSSLAFFYPYWTGKEPTWLYVQKIPMYFWLYPILALSGLIVSRKNRKILFFGVLAILGIFLTKQEGAPFGFIYDFLFSHIPGFSAFREASKFDYITLLSFAVLIGAFADFAFAYFKNKKLKYLFIFLIALLPLWNTKPLITGEIKTMFVPITVNQDFYKLKDFVLKDPNYSRVVGVSLNGKYSFSTYVHPEQDLLSSMAHFWGPDVVAYNFDDKTKSEGEKLMDYLATDQARRLLSTSSVGYMPVFIQDDPSFQSIRRDTGKDGSYITGRMDKIPYLVKANIGTKNIALYVMSDYKPHLYLTMEPETLKKDVPYSTIDFRMINPSEYSLNIKNLSKPVHLNFTELYDPNWKIHVGKFNWWEVLLSKNYFLPDPIHSQNAVRFNQFYLDPKKICSNTPCNFEATLYAKPQSYLYLGLILSGGVLALTIGSVFYLWKRNEK